MKKIKELTLPNFKTCYKATEIKTMWYWPKEKYIHPWNRIDTPEINH